MDEPRYEVREKSDERGVFWTVVDSVDLRYVEPGRCEFHPICRATDKLNAMKICTALNAKPHNLLQEREMAMEQLITMRDSLSDLIENYRLAGP